MSTQKYSTILKRKKEGEREISERTKRNYEKIWFQLFQRALNFSTSPFLYEIMFYVL
jgi:hypothetical protein